MSSSSFARLLVCLSAAGSVAAGAGDFLAKADVQAAMGEGRRLQMIQEGHQCGNNTADGEWYGDCDSGLLCVAPLDVAPKGTPSQCRRVCGGYDEVKHRPQVNHSVSCIPGQACTGHANTECGGGPAQAMSHTADHPKFKSCPDGQAAKFYMFCWE